MMRCRSCDYDLRALSERRCPECATPFDPTDASTFRAQQWWQRDPAAFPRTIALIGAVYPLLWIGLLYSTWLLGRLHVGHWPKPGWEQAKRLGPPFTTVGNLLETLAMIGFGIAVVSMYCAILAAGISGWTGRGMRRSTLVLLLCALAWIGALWYIRADPHRVICWLWD